MAEKPWPEKNVQEKAEWAASYAVRMVPEWAKSSATTAIGVVGGLALFQYVKKIVK